MSEVRTKQQVSSKVWTPKFYQVILLNDDYTPMDFVVEILEVIFSKTPEEATRIMLEVHNSGTGVCGTYTKDIGETKVWEVKETAKLNDFPLQCELVSEEE